MICGVAFFVAFWAPDLLRSPSPASLRQSGVIQSYGPDWTPQESDRIGGGNGWKRLPAFRQRSIVLQPLPVRVQPPRVACWASMAAARPIMRTGHLMA